MPDTPDIFGFLNTLGGLAAREMHDAGEERTDLKRHYSLTTVTEVLCGRASWTSPFTDDPDKVTCQRCLNKLQKVAPAAPTVG